MTRPKKKLRLSIITICLNDPEGLQKTLESTEAIHRRFDGASEQIVVDSSPEAHRKIRELYPAEQWPQLHWIETKPEGIYRAMNDGIRNANGNLLWHLNAGDLLSDTSILEEAILKIEADEDFDILFSPVAVVAEDEFSRVEYPNEDFKSNLKGQIRICHQGVLVKRKTFLTHGGFREDLRIVADYDFWIRIANAGCKGLYFSKPFVRYDNTGMSAKQVGACLAEIGKVRHQLEGSTRDQFISFAHYRWAQFKHLKIYPALKGLKLYEPIRALYRKTKEVDPKPAREIER